MLTSSETSHNFESKERSQNTTYFPPKTPPTILHWHSPHPASPPLQNAHKRSPLLRNDSPIESSVQHLQDPAATTIILHSQLLQSTRAKLRSDNPPTQISQQHRSYWSRYYVQESSMSLRSLKTRSLFFPGCFHTTCPGHSLDPTPVVSKSPAFLYTFRGGCWTHPSRAYPMHLEPCNFITYYPHFTTLQLPPFVVSCTLQKVSFYFLISFTPCLYCINNFDSVKTQASALTKSSNRNC